MKSNDEPNYWRPQEAHEEVDGVNCIDLTGLGGLILTNDVSIEMALIVIESHANDKPEVFISYAGDTVMHLLEEGKPFIDETAGQQLILSGSKLKILGYKDRLPWKAYPLSSNSEQIGLHSDISNLQDENRKAFLTELWAELNEHPFEIQILMANAILGLINAPIPVDINGYVFDLDSNLQTCVLRYTPETKVSWLGNDTKPDVGFRIQSSWLGEPLSQRMLFQVGVGEASAAACSNFEAFTKTVGNLLKKS